jgi:hypothetical protein
MPPTNEQLANRANPTPYSINLPGEGTTFRAVGDTMGDAVYQIKNGQLQTLYQPSYTANTRYSVAGKVYNPGDTTENFRDVQWLDPSYRGTATSRTNAFDAYNKATGKNAQELAEYNMGDLYQYLEKNGGRLPAGTTSATMNDGGVKKNVQEQLAAAPSNPNGVTPAGVSSQQSSAATGPAPMFNGSIVDLLNSVGADSSFANRQKLAEQYGVAGYKGTAAQNQDLSKKYLAAFSAVKGSAAPQDGAAGRQGVQDALGEQTEEQDPQASFWDAYAGMNPVVKTLYDNLNNALSSSNTKTSFVDEYNKLTQAQGIPGLQADLLNIKKVMEGTEDDIRTEIAKGGGFATDSQVQALVTARNKTFLKQAQSLSDQLQMKEDYVQQIMNLTKADRDAAEKEVDRKLGISEKVADLQTKMDGAARTNYQKIIDNFGYAGLSKAVAGNKQMESYAEGIMGLPQGSLGPDGALSSLGAGGDYQFVSGTENQQAGYFDKKTGKFTPLGGGGSGSSSGGSTGTNGGKYTGVINTILGSGTFTKQQAAAITNSINNGEDPATVIKNNAKKIMGQTEATTVTKYEAAQKAMQNLKNDMNAFYTAGGDTSFVKGNYEGFIGKLGTVSDPKLRELATRIQTQLQVYRNAVSGTAYSVQEGADIASIFPGINKTKSLNDAIFAGRDRAFDDAIDSAYETVLGSAYGKLVKAQGASTSSGTKTGTLPNGTKVFMSADGMIKDASGNKYDSNGNKIK